MSAAELALCYHGIVAVALVVSGVIVVATDKSANDPGRLAKMVTAGVFWPAAIVGLVLFVLGLGMRVLARSYAAWWRSCRGPRVPRVEVVSDRKTR